MTNKSTEQILFNLTNRLVTDHFGGTQYGTQFSDLYRQVATIVINQKGVAQGRLSRAEEYAIFCFGPGADVVAQEDDLLILSRY